jgi:hypothetical protein
LESAQAIRDCADSQVIGLTRRHVFFGICIGDSTVKLIVNAIGMSVGLFVLGVSNAQQLERWEGLERMVLLDTFTDLEWTRRDNLKDINWHDAKAYCDALEIGGGGWRLPTMDELDQLIDERRYGNTPCGAYAGKKFSCPVTPKFYLTGPFVWSSEQTSSSRAWGMLLSHDTPSSPAVSVSGGRRALCVRRRS